MRYFFQWLFGSRHVYAEKQLETKVYHWRGIFTWYGRRKYIRLMAASGLKSIISWRFHGDVIDKNPPMEYEDE